MSNLNICYAIDLPSGGTLKIAELIPAEQLPMVESTMSQHRQREVFTWHTLAREMLQDPAAKFCYNQVGAPKIECSEVNISVSHSATHVAVLLSPVPCAVDIESLNRNFERVASRYVSDEENKFSNSDLWSIKETLYKYAGKPGLNLRDQIEVLDISQGCFTAQIYPSTGQIKGSVTNVLDHTLAYIG